MEDQREIDLLEAVIYFLILQVGFFIASQDSATDNTIEIFILDRERQMEILLEK